MQGPVFNGPVLPPDRRFRLLIVQVSEQEGQGITRGAVLWRQPYDWGAAVNTDNAGNWCRGE